MKEIRGKVSQLAALKVLAGKRSSNMFKNKLCSNRNSRFLSEYEDRGAFIEVTRVEWADESLRFRVRRDKLELKEKTT